MTDESQIAKNIKHLRIQRGLTIKQLAEITGFSQGYISRIENSDKAPPVSTLIILSKAFGIDTSLFFSNDISETNIVVVKKDERKEITQDGSAYGYNYISLSHKLPHRTMEAFLTIVPRKLKQKKLKLFQHKGEEMIFVLKGKFKLKYGEKEYILDEGDFTYFDSSVPHMGFCEEGDQVETLIVINSGE